MVSDDLPLDSLDQRLWYWLQSHTIFGAQQHTVDTWNLGELHINVLLIIEMNTPVMRTRLFFHILHVRMFKFQAF